MKIYDRVPSEIKLPEDVEIELDSDEFLEYLPSSIYSDRIKWTWVPATHFRVIKKVQ